MSNIVPITPNHSLYPSQLKEIPYPPAELHILGDASVLSRPMLAVVGTRKPSPYGLSVLQDLLEPVLRAGIIIASGLALGIDGRAHQISVDLGAPTVAVLGCGVDRIYPWEHTRLAQQIVEKGGAIISEFSDGTPPLRHHFPQRNRIISGLSKAVLLVEAGEKSGALITAKFAVEQNRDVLVIPGNITSPQSIGPLNWLRLGATPVMNAADILCAFSIESEPTKPRQTSIFSDDPIEAALLENLRKGPEHIDTLTETCRLDSSVVSAALSLLEIRGSVIHEGGMIYRLNT